MTDLIFRNCLLPHAVDTVDIGCADGRIVAVEKHLPTKAQEEIDAGGFLTTPPFVDSHFHLDSALSFGNPRVNKSGTLLEGIGLWGELKRIQSAADIAERAMRMCEWSIAKGVLAIRSHVDVSDPSLATVEALLSVQERMRPYLDIQLTAFPQDGYYRFPDAEKLLIRALDLGVEVVGGIPHYERTMEEGAASVKSLCRIAADRGLLVDMHCDESDDPNSRHIEVLAAEAKRFGLAGKVAASHLTSMHSMDNYYASKLLHLIAESEITVIANPLVNIALQGRHDSYPKRRGLTRIKEMWAHGIPVALGHDCVMDPWYSFGSHDMLEVASMAIHAGHLTAIDEVAQTFDSVTTVAARTLGLKDYGIAPGKWADFVVLQARSAMEAVRLKPARLFVVRRGKIIARTNPTCSTLRLDGGEKTVDFTLTHG